jgi:preprotein translocase subunit SecD
VAPTTTTSRPWRYLAALGVLLVVMLLGVLGSNIGSPSHWHKSFKVALGLDLSSGSQITLQAITAHGKPSAAALNEAKNIITDRVDGDGLSNATVVTQNDDQIVVSVPGVGATKIQSLVESTALLRFRAVLLAAPNYTTSTSTTSPSPSTSTSPSSSTSPSPSTSTSPSSSTSPSPTTSSTKSSSGKGQSVSAKLMPASGATSTPKTSSSPKASSTPSPTPSPSGSTSTKLSTTADGVGAPLTDLTATTKKLFDELNCADKNWQEKIYGDNPSVWDKPGVQTVACQDINGVPYKYALDKAVVVGTDLTGVSADYVSPGGWVIEFNVKSPASTALLNLTTTQASLYNTATSEPGGADYFLNQIAVVLDGDIQSTPQTQQAFGPSGEINGGSTGFSEAQADNLANILKYGQLPLSFKQLDLSSVSPQLGSAQLSAGLIAGAIGLLLVIIYSLTYYRALAVVSVSSLAIAAALSYLSVILLSAYEGFNLTLAGVAGLIVAIGITADSFVVFFERLRDEVRDGKSLRAGVEAGWVRARRTVLVSDTVSFLAALLLYIFSIGEVRGFAFTLGLTTLIDVLVVFLFTKPMVTLLARTKFYGQGHKWSGLDPARLGSRAPWRGARRPARPASGTAQAASRNPSSPREA